jgi:hypothetical protein
MTLIIHRPPTYTRSRLISIALSLLYHGTYAYLALRMFGPVFTLLTMLVLVPHLGFYPDRLRQFTESMGAAVSSGAPSCTCDSVVSAGCDALLFEGPVEQAPASAVLNSPLVGFPRLLWRVVHDANAFARERSTW